MNGTVAVLSIIIPIVALVAMLGLMYVIIKSAVISALQRARREAWTEENMPEKAVWLSQRQRDELAQYNAGRTPSASA